MVGKSKGDDTNEKMIRYLLKMPENRRCINCNSLGPQYVCTTFWTFICTNCSGVHREFTHRVKSVSMAKFTDEEVNALQAGGNESARQTYLKTWDPGCNTLPRNSNTNKLREFIKNVYQDRRYTGDINRFSKLASSKKDDPYNHKFSDKNAISKQNTTHGQSRSKSPTLEVMDERNERLRRREATEMFTTADLKKDKCSKVYDDSVPSNIPVLRSIREILGENAPTLQVEKQSQAKRGTSSNTSAIIAEKVTSPKKETSNNEAATEYESTNLESLIDFTTQSNTPLDSSGYHGDEKDVAPQVPYSNTLEYLLFELSPPIEPSPDTISPLKTASSDNMLSTSNELVLYNQCTNSNTPSNSVVTDLLDNNIPIPSNVTLGPIKTIQERDHQISTPSSSNGVREPKQTFVDNRITSYTTHDLHSLQQCDNFALVPTSSRNLLAQPMNSSEVANIQIEAIDHNGQEPVLRNFAHGEIDVVANLSTSTRSNFPQRDPTQRKEIPCDLFNTNSSSGLRAPFPIWQNDPYNNMGYSMPYQYQNLVPYMQGSVQTTFTNPPLSTNPFDMNNNLSQVQPNTYPLMISTHGTLSNFIPIPQGMSSTSVAHQMQGTYMEHNLYNSNPASRVSMEPLESIYANQQATYKQFGPTKPSQPPPRAGNPFA